MSEYVYIKITFNTLVFDKKIKQQCTRLRLRVRIETKGEHFKLKL